jgi:hypothetical protein
MDDARNAMARVRADVKKTMTSQNGGAGMRDEIDLIARVYVGQRLLVGVRCVTCKNRPERK